MGFESHQKTTISNIQTIKKMNAQQIQVKAKTIDDELKTQVFIYCLWILQFLGICFIGMNSANL
ncbi:MAG: hypothetical protein ACPGJV_04550 [Bacteriovoracaceae bacterium]